MTIKNFDIIKNFLTFDDKDDFYFLQIIQRKKDGNQIPSANNGYRTIKTYYIRSLEDFDRRKNAIIQLCKQNNARAYINLNVRNAREVALTAAKAYIDLVREDRCSQGHRVYDHACGITPKMGVKKKRIVDIDDLSPEEVDTICNIICKCRSAFPMENPDADMYDNIIAEIPTAHGVHIITHGFDVERFREILEQTTKIRLTKDQIKEITNVKKDNPTLLYFDDKSQPSDIIIALQKYLDETSPEQLKKDWEELEQYNQYGPEMIDSLELSRSQYIAENQKDCPPEFLKDVKKISKTIEQLKKENNELRNKLKNVWHTSDEKPEIYKDKISGNKLVTYCLCIFWYDGWHSSLCYVNEDGTVTEVNNGKTFSIESFEYWAYDYDLIPDNLDNKLILDKNKEENH